MYIENLKKFIFEVPRVKEETVLTFLQEIPFKKQKFDYTYYRTGNITVFCIWYELTIESE